MQYGEMNIRLQLLHVQVILIRRLDIGHNMILMLVVKDHALAHVIHLQVIGHGIVMEIIIAQMVVIYLEQIVMYSM